MSVVLATVGCAPPRPAVSEAVAENMREQVQLMGEPGGTLSYLRAGDPKGPRLILVHGTPGSGSGWVDYLANPPPGMEVVALDRPGFGKSLPDQAEPSLAAQAKAVIALFPTDGRPVLLLGHSLGGPIVALVAAMQPQRVSAVVLLAASLDPAQEQIHPMQYVGDWGMVRAVLPRAIRNANTELMALKPELESLRAWLPQVRAKVVIMHGTKDDLVPVANVPYMQQHLAGAQCVKTMLLEGRNHFLPWNSAADVRAAIQEAASSAC